MKQEPTMQTRLSRFGFAVLAALGLAVVTLSAPPMLGGPTPAAAQVSEDFVYALEPYGRWIRHRRFGEVWVPADLPRDWRPYEYGHWVYTDEWGWFWVSDPEEEDWGWIAFHYGRWAFERGLGWFWVPGDEWAPAWVDWRYGDGYVGWAPLPPDPYIAVYEADPLFWVFVAVRHLTQPRWRHYAVESRHRAAWLRRSHVVNRTFGVRGARLAVNPGLSPAFVAAQTHSALPAYRVRPRVLGRTQGVAGAVQVNRADLRAGRGTQPRGRSRSSGANAVTLQQTTTIKPSTSAAPQQLQKGQRGHLGSHPPRAAQGGAAPNQQQIQPPPSAQPQPLQQQKSPQPVQQQQQRDHQPPQVKPTPPLVPQTPPPAVKQQMPAPAVKTQTPPPTVKKALPPTMKKQVPAPTVKQSPPPTVKRVAPPPTVKHAAPPAQPKRPVVKQAPPPAKKQAAPAKPAAKPAAKKKSDDKKKPDEKQ
jgi:hypothetical protein